MPVFDSELIAKIIVISSAQAVNFRVKDRKESHYVVISGKKHSAPKILFHNQKDNKENQQRIRVSFKHSALFAMQCRTGSELKNCRLFFLIRTFCDKKTIDKFLLEHNIWAMTKFDYGRQITLTIPVSLIKICSFFDETLDDNVTSRIATEIKTQIRKQKIKMTKRQIQLSLKDAMILFSIKALGTLPKGDIDVR